jgi:uroporphyrinogen III methyltransferase / synthase
LEFVWDKPCSKEARTGFCGSREDPLDTTEKHLAGKRIVVTRASEHARELTRALEQMGAEVLLLPTVSFVPADDWTALDNALQEMVQFDWVLFTSQNAVRFFCQRCHERGVSRENFASSKLRIGAVGTVTAEAITHEGIRVDRVAKGQTGESLAHELRTELGGRRVLLPRSDRADDRLPKALREAGAIVTEVVAYRTLSPMEFDPEIIGRVRRAEVDAIIFASPSAFHNLRDSLGTAELAKLSARLQFVAIGPTTARAMREAGVRVGIETEESTSAGLAKAIANHYERKNSTVRSS